MKKTGILLAFCLLTIPMMAQEKKTFTLDDLMPGGSSFYNLLPENIYTTWWGDKAVKLGIDNLIAINPQNGKEEVILTIEEAKEVVSKENAGYLGHLYQATLPYPKEKKVWIKTKSHRLLYDFGKKTVCKNIKSDSLAANEDFEPISQNLAYTIANNLYVVHQGEIQQVTNEAKGIVCGQSVHREEFGITKGTFWSPKGKLLAFYRMDQSMVSDYPQVDISQRVATQNPDKYPMAGMTSHKVTVGIYNPTTQKTTYLQAGDPTDRYFTNIAWSPDESKIYMIELNRDQNHAELVRYDAVSGAREQVLFEESHPKYVEPCNPITFLPWESTQFIYQTRKDGYKHLYIYNVEGTCVKQLTSGKWEVTELLGFNTGTREVLIQSNETSPIQKDIFAVNIANGKRRMLTNGDGIHDATLSKSGTYIDDYYTSPTVACQINLLAVKDKKRLNLLDAKDPWDAYNVPEITVGTIKAADGITDLYYRLVKPTHFDANKKYPAIIYVYGGPHAHNVDAGRHWGVRGWDIYMAQLGYVMLTVDNRGSENRGLEFENCTFRHLGEIEMKDQLKGVEFLKSLPYVDSNRLGVHGWSFGGFMTTNLMCSYPDVFKVGVAGGPVIDWKYYEVMYGERYMDTPQTNPEGYKGSNLCEKAGNLKGRLQIIFGYNDPTCVPQHTLSFIRACIDKGTQPDLFTYPGQGHNMVGKDRVHLHERITRYFEDYLK